VINSCLHTLMHHIGTFVAFDQHSGKELNKVLNCAQGPGASMPVGYLGSHQLTLLQFPACPLPETDEKVGYLAGVLFHTRNHWLHADGSDHIAGLVLKA